MARADRLHDDDRPDGRPAPALGPWSVTAGGRPIVVDLEGERYDRLIVEVEVPHATVDAINAAATSRRRPA